MAVSETNLPACERVYLRVSMSTCMCLPACERVYLRVSNDADDGAVAFQLGKVLLNLFLPGVVCPLYGRLCECLLLGPVPTTRGRPRGRG